MQLTITERKKEIFFSPFVSLVIIKSAMVKVEVNTQKTKSLSKKYNYTLYKKEVNKWKMNSIMKHREIDSKNNGKKWCKNGFHNEYDNRMTLLFLSFGFFGKIRHIWMSPFFPASPHKTERKLLLYVAYRYPDGSFFSFLHLAFIWIYQIHA